jgi:hypothetical protein
MRQLFYFAFLMHRMISFITRHPPKQFHGGGKRQFSTNHYKVFSLYLFFFFHISGFDFLIYSLYKYHNMPDMKEKSDRRIQWKNLVKNKVPLSLSHVNTVSIFLHFDVTIHANVNMSCAPGTEETMHWRFRTNFYGYVQAVFIPSWF